MRIASTFPVSLYHLNGSQHQQHSVALVSGDTTVLQPHPEQYQQQQQQPAPERGRILGTNIIYTCNNIYGMYEGLLEAVVFAQLHRSSGQRWASVYTVRKQFVA